jgi:hypothetical protein
VAEYFGRGMFRKPVDLVTLSPVDPELVAHQATGRNVKTSLAENLAQPNKKVEPVLQRRKSPQSSVNVPQQQLKPQQQQGAVGKKSPQVGKKSPQTRQKSPQTQQKSPQNPFDESTKSENASNPFGNPEDNEDYDDNLNPFAA